MPHDINKKRFANIFQKIKITKEIIDCCCSKKLQTNAHPFSTDNNWCTNTIKTKLT